MILTAERFATLDSSKKFSEAASKCHTSFFCTPLNLTFLKKSDPVKVTRVTNVKHIKLNAGKKTLDVGEKFEDFEMSFA
jgi:hypothetical protein